MAASRQNAAPPRLQLAILILPPSRAFNAILNPTPYSPILNLAGIRTLSNVTKAVGWIVQPIFYYFLPKLMPFASPGTINAEIFLASVFAITMYVPLKLPPEINIFDPFKTYYYPYFFAVDFIA